MHITRLRRWLRRTVIGLALFVIAGVWLTWQFPGLIAGRKSSVEVLQDLFSAPVEVTEQTAQQALATIKKGALIGFIKSCDLPPRCRTNLVRFVRSDRLDTVALPFLAYLYELYGAPVTGDAENLADLGFAEPPASTLSGGAGLGTLVRQSRELSAHVSNSLRLFEAIFLRTKPGADGKPLDWKYDESAYREIKAIVREIAHEALARSDDDRQHTGPARQKARSAFQQILNDDERLTSYVEFFTDFIRDLSRNWLESFVGRDQRQRRRSEWVERRIEQGRYHEIADYARAGLARKRVLHVVVDGLQGKLLEGLVQLSSGDRLGSGARYLKELDRVHRSAAMHPTSYPSGQRTAPAPLGIHIQHLVRDAPLLPEFLPTLKHYFFSPQAESVVVSVATVDTPTISVRNLPIVYSGHGVAGPFGTGIPNFSYLDRVTDRGWYFWGSDMLHFRRIFANRENEIPHGRKRPQGPGARTLFDRLWRYNTVSAMPTIDTGALEKISVEVGTAVGELKRNFIEKTIVLRFRRRAETERQLNTWRQWLVEHRRLSSGFLAELVFNANDLATFRKYARSLARHEDEGLPDYLLWYNPWPDHFAHAEGPYSDAIIGLAGEYARFDFYLGKVLDTYRSVDAGDGHSSCLDHTLVGIVSDHGLIYTPFLVNTDKLLFDALAREGIRMTVQKLTVDEGELPAIRGREGGTPARRVDAIVGSTAGGSYVIDLFSKSTSDHKTAEPHPDYHALRKYRLASGQTIDWIDALQRHLGDVMDLALVREYGPKPGEEWDEPVESAVRIVTPDRGGARIVRVQSDGRTLYRYQVIGDRDPLELLNSIRPELIGPDGPDKNAVRRELSACLAARGGCDERRWQRWLSYTSRPDCVYQLSHLYDTDRAGTINVFPLAHVGMNSSVPGRHAGETFGEKNGTQLYHARGLRKSVLQTARNGSLPVTLYHWFVGDSVFDAAEKPLDVAPRGQFGFPSLLDEKAFEPLTEGRRVDERPEGGGRRSEVILNTEN